MEGKNIVIEWRSAEGKVDRLPTLAGELVSLKVDIIVTGTPNVTLAAKNATKAIPVVFACCWIRSRSEFVASLAQPGGNLTGLTVLAPELSGKRLELLKETSPRITRVAPLRDWSIQSLERTSDSKIAYSLQGCSWYQLQYLDVLDPKDIETAFQIAAKGRANAVVVLGSPVNRHLTLSFFAPLIETISRNNTGGGDLQAA